MLKRLRDNEYIDEHTVETIKRMYETELSQTYTDSQIDVFLYVLEHEPVTTKQIILSMHVSESTVRKALSEFKKARLLYNKRAGKGYDLNEKIWSTK